MCISKLRFPNTLKPLVINIFRSVLMYFNSDSVLFSFYVFKTKGKCFSNVQLVSIQKALLLHSGEYFERLTLCNLWTWISYFRVYCFRHKSNIIFHSKYSSAMMKSFNLVFFFSMKTHRYNTVYVENMQLLYM